MRHRSDFVLRAAWTLAPDGVWVEGGGVHVRRGRVVSILASPGAVTRSGLPTEDLGDVLLLPGFVDAHAHLELSGLAGAVAPGASFPDWIRALLAARAQRTPHDLERDARAGAARLLGTGTTCVGDIDTSAALARSMSRTEPGSHPPDRALGMRPSLRVRRFREVLDAGDPARATAALRVLEDGGPGAPLWSEGLSPHAPYTVSSRLWAELGRIARRRRLPVAIHWAETRAETEWLEHGGGTFAALLRHPPARSGLDAIEQAGLLGARTALVHGNDATAAERERVARAGATLVHCPGTHAFFGREPFDARAWVRAGVPLALGTDSLASNADLDMRREMALFRAAHPGFTALDVLACATEHAARAVGHAGRIGTLRPGAWADLAAHAVPGIDGPARLEALTHGLGRVTGVWIAGNAPARGLLEETGALRGFPDLENRKSGRRGAE